MELETLFRCKSGLAAILGASAKTDGVSNKFLVQYRKSYLNGRTPLCVNMWILRLLLFWKSF